MYDIDTGRITQRFGSKWEAETVILLEMTVKYIT